MGMKPRIRYVILAARPEGRPPVWWPRDGGGRLAWVTVKREGNGWSYTPDDTVARRVERIPVRDAKAVAEEFEEWMDRNFAFRREEM